jgi:hypothetical protein
MKRFARMALLVVALVAGGRVLGGFLGSGNVVDPAGARP